MTAQSACLGHGSVTEDVKDSDPSERHGTAPYSSHSLTSLTCRRNLKGQLMEPFPLSREHQGSPVRG